MTVLPEITVKDFLADVVLNVNDIMSSELFSDAFLVRKLNYAIMKIYTFALWSWEIQRVNEVNLTQSNFSLDYKPKAILKMKTDKSNDLKWSIDILSSNDHFNIVDNNLTFYETISTLQCVYRKWPQYYTVTDLGSGETASTKLDLPLEYHGILSDLMTASLVPLWLGEGVGQLQVNFFQEAIRQLQEMKKSDAYINPLQEFSAQEWR